MSNPVGQFNYGHPLWKGLTFWAPCLDNEENSSGNARVRNIVGDGEYNDSVNGTPNWNNGILRLNRERINFTNKAVYDPLDLQVSVSIWVRMRRSPGTNQIIMNKGDSGANTGWSMRLDGGNFQFQLDDSGSRRASSSIRPEFDGQWYHCCGTWNGKGTRDYDLSLYLNGRFVAGDVSATSVNATTAPLRIGGRNGTPTNYLDADVMHAMVWQRTLEPSEVMMLTKDPWVLYRKPRAHIPAGTGGGETPAPDIGYSVEDLIQTQLDFPIFTEVIPY